MIDERVLDEIENSVVTNPEYNKLVDEAIRLLELLNDRLDLDQEGKAALDALEHALAEAQGVAVRQAFQKGLAFTAPCVEA
ncbi:hypothetical protein ACFOQM_07800 [Paenibacillus sp. GCM10012307]|uniref:Uncharacterized protein n=1 Tax=Paenibacillus roseus TaxID=2798579 RepID=A0A934MPT2_9BACL|nr:hypothetical protein [Paenibacillus roseus]MBJ6361193.1 hypothetical protein [Paenibacillus roseus]